MTIPHILILLGALIVALWGVTALRLLSALRAIPPLARILSEGRPDGASREANRLGGGTLQDAPAPALSVVVTARDEADGIETTVKRLLSQRYPGLEIVVVDDRSSDGTGAILDRLRSALPDGGPRLEVIHNETLPEGWIGKCHACHLGASRARGAWILFTDGDVALEDPEILIRVVAHAERCRLDHVTVFPDLRPMSPWQAGLVAAFGQLFILGSRLYEMEQDRPRGGGGVGAFNLVRRSAYDRIGGHRLLRMDLVDDYKLGMLLKESGARQRFFNGAGLVRCPWHRGARNVVRGLEKNFFSGFNYSLIELTAVTTLLAALSYGPAILGTAVTALTWRSASAPLLVAAWLPLIVQSVSMFVGFSREARRYGYSPLALTLLHPLSMALVIVAAWNSALTTLRQGGARWRETFYPLRALRAGLVRPGDGRRFLDGRTTVG